MDPKRKMDIAKAVKLVKPSPGFQTFYSQSFKRELLLSILIEKLGGLCKESMLNWDGGYYLCYLRESSNPQEEENSSGTVNEVV